MKQFNNKQEMIDWIEEQMNDRYSPWDICLESANYDTFTVLAIRVD